MKTKMLLLFFPLLLACAEVQAGECGLTQREFEKRKAETLDKLRKAEEAYDYIIEQSNAFSSYWRRMLWENYFKAHDFWAIQDTTHDGFYYGSLAGIDSVKQNRMYMRSWMEVDYVSGHEFVVPRGEDTVTIVRVSDRDYILVRLAKVTRETKLGNVTTECLTKKQAWDIIHGSPGFVAFGYSSPCPVFGELRDKCYKENASDILHMLK